MLRKARWLLFIACAVAGIVPALSAPEERVAFQRNDPPAVTVMFLDGTVPVDLTPSRKFTDPCVTPTLAPDGRSIAFAAMVGNQFKIFQWKLDEKNTVFGEPKRLTSSTTNLSEKFPAWSPDGKRIAFLATDTANRTTLRVINVDGSGLAQLASVNYSATPAWSPDSKQLLYIDQLGGSTQLENVVVSGGKPLPIHAELKVTAACYSPDGETIAALTQQAEGNSDLALLAPWGIGAKAIVKGIVGAKSVSWRTAEKITFNASKVGTLSGKAIWTVTPKGDELKGITGYADPKNVAYAAVQKCDLTPYVPTALAPTAENMGTGTPVQAQDLADILAAHAVTIISPSANATVHGTVPIKVIARKNVAGVTILINGLFAYSVWTLDVKNPIPTVSYTWDTTEFGDLDPSRGLPTAYADFQRYPDGTYTICAQALDDNHNLIDQHIITVTVQNSIIDSGQPQGPVDFRYQFSTKASDDYFRVHGDGAIVGNGAADYDPLIGTLDAAFRRRLIKPLPDGLFGFNTEIRGPGNRPAISYGKLGANLPEQATVGAYTLNNKGDLVVVPVDGRMAYNPLTQALLPLAGKPVSVGDSWTKPMWVVADLLDREATQVKATHTLDGFEWANGRRAARFRSTFAINANVLSTSVNDASPGLRGDRSKRGGGNDTVAVQSANGIRYAWFDLESQKILRTDDIMVYTLDSHTWYVVHYRSTTMADPTKKKTTK